MRQKLYLHIGLGKTGTTAIQHFCEDNEPALQRHGIAYSPHRIYEYWPTNPEPYDKALQFIDANLGKGRDILVSDECIYFNFAHDPRAIELKDRYPDLDIHAIVYLRRQDLHLESLINFLQFTGMGEDRFEWIEFPSSFKTPYPGITAESYDYYAWIKPLSETLGRDNVHVRVYEPGRFAGGTIFSDFLDVLGIPLTDEFVMPTARANPSLDARFTRLLKAFYSEHPTSHSYERRIAAQALGAVNVSMGITRRRSLFSVEERRELLDHFGKGNGKLAAEFFGEDGPLFDTTLADKEEDRFDDDELQLLPGLLNKVWYETLADMDFGAFNTFKMQMYQDRYHSGDASARKRYLFHKVVNSLCKRFSKSFFKPINWHTVDVGKKR